MRWKKPNDGDLRVITKFLLFPKEIDGETRWLEVTHIKQKYCWNIKIQMYSWLDIEWLDYNKKQDKEIKLTKDFAPKKPPIQK